MAIDLSAEKVFPLNEARIPSRQPGKKVAYSTLWRWANRGVRGVRLEATPIGGTLYTSAEALQRFADALRATRDPGTGPPATSPTATGLGNNRVAEELRRIFGEDR